jgi:alpha-glucosidase
MTKNTEYPWWETGVVYQIYPRSFQDSNGDGIGDLKGIQTRLPYLQDLGITAIWISPIYPSPMVDCGYDVSDYTDIHPIFGTMADFLELLDDVHRRGLKLILDFVPNHTSDQYPWFIESRSSRDNAKRDWYIWKNAKPDGTPPNNWVSYFGGSAWEWDEPTGQYYLRLFAKEQPDLNWRHPDVVRNMLNVLRFWLERGVDGFRVDVLFGLLKDALFRDDTPNPHWTPAQPIVRSTLHDRSEGQVESHDLIRQMRAVLDEYGERVLIGEISTEYPFNRLVSYYGKLLDECHLPFNFSLTQAPFTVEAIQRLVQAYEQEVPQGAWLNWVLGNHDQDRIASVNRAGAVNARLAHMLLLTLRGTPTMYYGDEIGLSNVEIPPGSDG